MCSNFSCSGRKATLPRSTVLDAEQTVLLHGPLRPPHASGPSPPDRSAWSSSPSRCTSTPSLPSGSSWRRVSSSTSFREILPVSWMYASEIMPLRTRNTGVALEVSTHWLSNLVVVYVTRQAIESLGCRLYIIWAVLNASFVPIMWFFYPEASCVCSVTGLADGICRRRGGRSRKSM